MTFYIFIAFISSFFYYIAVYLDKKHNTGKYIFFSLFLMIPAIIGGLRNTDIGTDMQVYGVLDFVEASRYTLVGYLSNATTPEYAYYILNYVCAQISSDINFFMFTAELIKIACVGCVAWNLRKEINSSVLVCTHLLSFWWFGFSMMRQSLAIAVCYIGILLMYRKKTYWAFFTFFIAYEFHSSAIFALLFSFIFYIKSNKLRFSVILGGSVAMFALWQVAVTYMAFSGLFRMDLDRYIDSGVTSDKSNIFIAVVSILLSLLLTSSKKNENSKNWNSILLNMSILYFSFLIMSQYIETAVRVAIYARIFVVMAACYLGRNVKLGRYNKAIAILYISLFIMAAYFSGMHGAIDTIPYKSEILGI